MSSLVQDGFRPDASLFSNPAPTNFWAHAKSPLHDLLLTKLSGRQVLNVRTGISMESEDECLLHCAGRQSLKISCIIRCVLLRIGCRFYTSDWYLFKSTAWGHAPLFEQKVPHYLNKKALFEQIGWFFRSKIYWLVDRADIPWFASNCMGCSDVTCGILCWHLHLSPL